MGSTKSYRVKINIIGYIKAGKSTLILQLLGKSFENLESTEGIHTQLIHTTFDPNHEILGPWEEIQLEIEKIVKDFNKQIILALNQDIGALSMQEEIPAFRTEETTSQSLESRKELSKEMSSHQQIKEPQQQYLQQ